MKLLVLRHFRAQQTDDADFFEKENAPPPLKVYGLKKVLSDLLIVDLSTF